MEIRRHTDSAVGEKQSCTDTDRLRALGKQARGRLTGKERDQKGKKAAQNLCALSEWQTAESFLLFVSFGTELPTRRLLETALLQKKAVYCPKVFPDEKRMEFYRIGGPEELKPGFGGILEPPEGKECFLAGKSGRALMVVPGTAFDRQGNRIGYGGGYYDRYVGAIPEKSRPVLAGLCFSCQLTERIAAKAHDVRMDLVVTENGAIHVPCQE